MALIKCPECEKDISDKVKSCPNCGYPMEIENNETQKVEISSVNIKMDKSKKNKIVKIVVLITVVVLVCIGGYSFIKSQNHKSRVEEYRSNILILTVDMIESGAEAEKLLSLTSKVWANAIYEDEDTETNKYTKPKGYFVSDFNTALKNLFTDNVVIDRVNSIESSQKSVAETMKKLNNPPEEYKSIYNTAMEMYTAYKSITDLAVNPQGSLQSFNDNRREKIDKFIEIYNKIEAQLPEE